MMCTDENLLCPAWAARGECRENMVFMARACAASCGTCGGHLCATPSVRVVAQDTWRVLEYGENGTYVASTFAGDTVCEESLSTLHCEGYRTDAVQSCAGCACSPVSESNQNIGVVRLLRQQCTGSTTRPAWLFVGLGTGVSATVLRRLCRQARPHIDVIEFDANMAEAAQLYFGYSKAPGEQIVIADAGEAISRIAESASYSGIIVDCMDGHADVPAGCRGDAFARQLSRLLKPGGFVLQWLYEKDWDSVHAAFVDSGFLTTRNLSDISDSGWSEVRRERAAWLFAASSESHSQELDYLGVQHALLAPWKSSVI